MYSELTVAVTMANKWEAELANTVNEQTNRFILRQNWSFYGFVETDEKIDQWWATNDVLVHIILKYVYICALIHK